MKRQTFIVVSFLFVLIFASSTLAPHPSFASTTFIDGEYTIPFEVLKDTVDDISATSDYMVSPAKLIVEDGAMQVEVTLKNSSWWQYFQAQAAPSEPFTDVTILNEDTEQDTRVVSFAIHDITQLLNAKIHIIVTGIPGFAYDNKYDIRFKFDHSGVPLAEATPETVVMPEDKQVNTVVEPNIVAEVETEFEAEVEIETETETEIEIDIANEIETETEAGTESAIDITEPVQEAHIANESEMLADESNETSENNVLPYIIVVLVLLSLLLFVIYRTRSKNKA